MDSFIHIIAVIRKCKQSDKDDRPADKQVWCLYTSDGSKLLGRHPSREKALAQERAIKAQGGASHIANLILEDVIDFMLCDKCD